MGTPSRLLGAIHVKRSVQLSTVVLIKLLTGDRTPVVYDNSLSSIMYNDRVQLP